MSQQQGTFLGTLITQKMKRLAKHACAVLFDSELLRYSFILPYQEECDDFGKPPQTGPTRMRLPSPQSFPLL